MGDPLPLLLELRVPQSAEHAVPFTVSVQVTPLFVPSLVTVAVNCWVALTATLAEGGDTDTDMGSMVIEPRPNAALLVTDVAWMNTPAKQRCLKKQRGAKCAGAV
jgi:hypothetical protein